MSHRTLSTSASGLIKIDVKALLRFFDEKPDWSLGHATSVVGVAGEDLNTACFLHYIKESKGSSATVLRDGSGSPLPVGPGTKKGPRLDRWIQVDWTSGLRTVFQTEIKNWSAHSLSGKTLSVSARIEEVREYKRMRWEHRWDSEARLLRNSPTGKVLRRMKPPAGVDEECIRPLLIFWEALGPSDRADDHLFDVEVNGQIPELWVFSVSSYLRSIRDDTLELDMPDAAHRLRSLDCLFQRLA